MTLGRTVGKAVFAAADLLLRSPEGPRLLIYHQVGSGRGRQMEVTREDFLWQLDWLTEHREVTTLDQALEGWEDPEAHRLVVLTFDDGYRDTHSVAFPALKERDIPFTLYLSTSHMETGELEEGAVPLTWDETASMVESGLVTIGSHTHNHIDLRTVSADRAEDELGQADELIVSKLGVVPRHFAYPWGYWAEAADGVVRARYESAALGSAYKSRNSTDRHQLHRFPVQLSDGRIWFGRRLAGGFLIEEKVRRRLRGYSGP